MQWLAVQGQFQDPWHAGVFMSQAVRASSEPVTYVSHDLTTGLAFSREELNWTTETTVADDGEKAIDYCWNRVAGPCGSGRIWLF
jgi:hypothetical protein